MSTNSRPLLTAGTALAIVTSVAGAGVLITSPVTRWFSASALLWLVGLWFALAWAWRAREPFFAIVGALFCAIVVGRLFGTLRLPGDAVAGNDPLLLAETGPGVPSVMWLATALAAVLALWVLDFIRRHPRQTPWGEAGSDTWVLTIARMYVGMMFIGHFSGHLFAGPAAFAVFEAYFGSIGLKPAAGAVVLGGVSELIAGLGLSLGLYTRLAALIGAGFLFMSMWWGEHFGVGYVWILPTGGWEFGIFWAVMVGLFIFAGGGTVSLDRVRSIRQGRPPSPEPASGIDATRHAPGR